MKTLLLLAQHPDLAESLRGGLNPEQFRVLQRMKLEEAEPLLAHGLADACLLDTELLSVQSIWMVDKLRRLAPRCPLVVLTDAKSREWEEEAYLQGAAFVLEKPVRPRMLSALLERLWAPPPASNPHPSHSRVTPAPSVAPLVSPQGIASAQPFSALREFSNILTHSLDAEGLTRQFLLLLREILSLNRGVIFLRQPPASLGHTGGGLDESRRLKPISSIGIQTSLLHQFELSPESGVGELISRMGRILRRSAEEVQNDPEAEREFHFLGAQVAVPILDRENVVGVALFDGRITGEALANQDLELIFRLLEQLGLALRNIWMHTQLSGSHEMMAEILRELSGACLVVNRDLQVIHANRMARKYFPAKAPGGELEFSDLPQGIGTRIYQVLKSGSALPNFRYQPENAPGAAYNVAIVPFQRQPSGSPASTLVMVEDLTKSEQLQRLEVEAAGLRLLRTMSERLTNEIGNALVPLSVHQQVLSEKLGTKKVDPEFLSSMERDLGETVRRVTRLASQLRFLARETPLSDEAFPVKPVIEEAFREARRHHPARAAELKCDAGTAQFIVKGDRTALKHAFAEIMLNALQANPDNTKIAASLRAGIDSNGSTILEIDVRDNGPGFSEEAQKKAGTPFFALKVVGLGLGLAVARKIAEAHTGKLEVCKPDSQPGGHVRLSLPIEVPKESTP
jgi:signal transduction histidine kinase